MFSVQKTRRYQQQNPMSNAGALLGLLSGQQEAYNGVVNAVDSYGQSQVKDKLSQLFQQEQYAGLTPEQAQAKIFGLTKGRDLGKSGEFMMASTLNNKQELQDIAAKQQLQAQGDAAAMARQKLSEAAKLRAAAMRGQGGGANGLLNQGIRSKYMDTIAKNQDNPELVNKLIKEGFLQGAFNKNDRIAFEKLGFVNDNSLSSTYTKSQLSGLQSGQTKALEVLRQKGYHPVIKDGLLIVNGKKISEATAQQMLKELSK